MAKRKKSSPAPAPEPIYKLFDARPNNDYRFAGWCTEAMARDYAVRLCGRDGKDGPDADWIKEGDLHVGPDWSLHICLIDDEKRYPCLPIIRKLLLEDPDCLDMRFPEYIPADTHGVVTICDAIVIKFLATGTEPDENGVISARGTMYLPFKDGTLELAYFYDHVKDQPKKSKAWVEAGPDTISFDSTGRGGAVRLDQLMRYAKILRGCNISGLWVEISGSGI